MLWLIPLPLSPLIYPPPPDDWPQWGGLERNPPGAGLAVSWPPEESPVVGRKSVSAGDSGIVVSHGWLCPAFREGSVDVVVALEAGRRWPADQQAAFELREP